MRITKIETQKKNKKRFNLFSDDVFLFGISEDTYVHFHIQRDKEYSDKELQEIQNHDEIMQCQAQALRYLSRRPHLRNELLRKLRQKMFESEIIYKTLNRLLDLGYINDRDFIERFISDEIRLKKSGPLIIKKKLLEKGASQSDIDEILGNSYSVQDQLENAQALFNKKTGTSQGSETKKILAHLQQKGYSWEIIRQVADLNK